MNVAQNFNLLHVKIHAGDDCNLFGCHEQKYPTQNIFSTFAPFPLDLCQKSSILLLLCWCGSVGRAADSNQQVAGSSPATSSINRAGFRLVILRGLFLCFLYKNSSALLCFSQQGACFVDYSFGFSVSGASSAEVFFAWGWGSSFTTGIKRLANLFLPRLRT